jgi:hypothetical protein
MKSRIRIGIQIKSQILIGIKMEKSDPDLGIKMKSQIRIGIKMKSRIRNLLLTCGGGDGQCGAGQGHHPVPHTSSQPPSNTPPLLFQNTQTRCTFTSAL